MPIATTWTRDRDSSGRERIDDRAASRVVTRARRPSSSVVWVNVTFSHESSPHHNRRLGTRTSSRPPTGTSATLDTGREGTRAEPKPQSGQCPTASTGSTSAHRPPDRPGRRAPGIRAGWTTPWPHHAAYPETRLVVPPTDASQHPSWRTTSPLHQQEATPLVEEPSNPSCRRRPGATRKLRGDAGSSPASSVKDANGRDHQRQVGDVVGGQLKLITPLDHRRQLPTPRAAALSCQPRRRRRAVPATSPRRESRMSPRTSR